MYQWGNDKNKNLRGDKDLLRLGLKNQFDLKIKYVVFGKHIHMKKNDAHTSEWM